MGATIPFDAALWALKSAPLTLDTLESTIGSLGFNHPTHFGPYAAGGLEMQQVPRELAEFAAYLVGQLPRKHVRYLEIGVGSCGTMLVLHEVLRQHGFTVELFGVDNLSYFNTIETMRNQRPRIEWMQEQLGATFHIGSTADRGFGDFLEGRHFDVIFIDGEHTYEACIREFLLTLPHLALGGVMAFHDVASRQCPGVVAAYDRIRPYFGATAEFAHSDICGIAACRHPHRAVVPRDVFRLMTWQTPPDETTPVAPSRRSPFERLGPLERFATSVVRKRRAADGR